MSGLEWDVMQVGGGDSVLARVSERMRSSEHLIREWSPALLKMELDRWFWRNRDHVPVKQVWDALCAYCYFPRLRDQSVFVSSIQAGITSGDYFAYATSVSQQGRYEGLTLGAPAAAIYVDATSVFVKPEAARAQLEAGSAPPPEGEAGAGTSTTGTGTDPGGAVLPDGAESRRGRRSTTPFTPILRDGAARPGSREPRYGHGGGGSPAASDDLAGSEGGGDGRDLGDGTERNRRLYPAYRRRELQDPQILIARIRGRVGGYREGLRPRHAD